MNIHYEEDFFDKLYKHKIMEIEFGSKLFGTGTTDSDKDIMVIYDSFLNERNSFLWENHNIQIKKDNTDYIFTTLKNFVRNLLCGDSTIYFEIIHCEEVKGTILEFFYNNRKEFYTFTTLKCYSGYLKRDLKYRNNYKRFSHAYRGALSIERILEGDYNNNFNEQLDIMLQLKTNTYKGCKDHLYKELFSKYEKYRVMTGELLTNGEIKRVCEEKFMKKIDNYLSSQTKNNNETIDLDKFYKALEDGLVTY